jgi:transposase-like protein
MNTEKKQQARNLYFQTGLNKTQIAAMLEISRRSLSYWVREGDWDRLKKSAEHLPAILIENCYHIFGNLTERYLSERRVTDPVKPVEIDALYKLTRTIKNLKSRAALNESIELCGHFMDLLHAKNPELAQAVMPYLDEYMTSRANINRDTLLPAHFTGLSGTIPYPDPDRTETLIDHREAFFSDPETVETYERWGIPFPSEEEISTLPGTPKQPADEENIDCPNETEEQQTTEPEIPGSEKQVRKNCAKSKTIRIRKGQIISKLSRKERKQEIARKSAQKHNTAPQHHRFASSGDQAARHYQHQLQGTTAA